MLATQALIDVSSYPDDIEVPSFRRGKCSKCVFLRFQQPRSNSVLEENQPEVRFSIETKRHSGHF